MIPIRDAAAYIQAHPAPVLLIDTCSLLDLFRRDSKSAKPRVSAEEIQAAVELLNLVTLQPEKVHLLAPELVPGEYANHADAIENEFATWTRLHDENQDWLAKAALQVAITLPAPSTVHPFGLEAKFRNLADELLHRSKVLDRDQLCLDRAVLRLIMKNRPSHKKEMKDSMNMEQCLELSRLLQQSRFPHSRIFVSSNTNDFAESVAKPQLHPDLQVAFAAAGLRYCPSLRAAIGQLRANNEIP